tara:strand:- start:1633 stop:2529 length:897 start_codon:yes stop_codon:yes gene_type:complete
MKKNVNIDIQMPKSNSYAIDTDDDFIKLPALICVNGKRHSGKTLSVVNYVREMKNKNYCDRCLVITPTYASNKNTWDIAEIDEQDVFEPGKYVLKDIKKFIQEEKDEWDQFLEMKEKYKEYQKMVKKQDLNVEDENLIKELLNYEELGFFDLPPSWKYKKEVPPRLTLVIDDSMGTDIMLPSAGLTKFVIAHRHWGEGLGISVFMLVQSYTAGAGQGLARPIREQTTQLWLFKIAQEGQLKKVFEESDLEINYEKYLELCNQVHSVPYNFLMIDFNAKDPEKKYRNGFKEFIKLENKM